jgi:hypothetical protein
MKGLRLVADEGVGKFGSTNCLKHCEEFTAHRAVIEGETFRSDS